VIFDTSFRREAARNLLGTAIVLATVVLTILLFRVLRQAANGAVDPADVAQIIGLSIVAYAPMLLTIALFLAVLLTLGRWYRDSEMAVWMASGAGLPSLIRPTLVFAWPVLLTIAAFTLAIRPWANEQIQVLRVTFEKRNDLARAAPGQFRESSDGSRVFFYEGEPSAGRAQRVFVLNRSPSHPESVTLASAGSIVSRDGFTLLQLERGYHYDFGADAGATARRFGRVAAFDRYEMRIAEAELVLDGRFSGSARSTMDLIGQGDRLASGELFWRASVPMSALILTLLALPLAAVHPRAGRSWHVLFAILVALTYYNFTNIGQAWVATGRYGPLPLFAGLHGFALFVAAAMLLRKARAWTAMNAMARLLQPKALRRV
jgi:lipopolysaccharide export system permease protein